MHVILQVAALTVLLVLAQELFCRAHRWILWCLFLVLPLALTPYWFSVNQFGPFIWIKCYSVFFCVCWGTLLQNTSLGQRPWARGTIPLLLAANILEATLVDLLETGLAHRLNALAGVLLMGSLPYGWRSVQFDNTRQIRRCLYGNSLAWVVGYTVWNWTFVYLNYPAFLGHHTAVLLAALLVALLNVRRWLQARAYTLGLNLFCMATSNDSLLGWLDTTNWVDQGGAIIVSSVVCMYMVGYTMRKGLTMGRPRGLRWPTGNPSLPTFSAR